MAKRVRGSTSRPGQRPPLQRTTARPAAKPATPTAEAEARPPASLTEAEEARAAELEAAIVAEEKAAEAASRKARTPRPETVAMPRTGSSLAASAAEEYGYVARDVRKIALLGGSLVGFLLLLWVISNVTGFAGF